MIFMLSYEEHIRHLKVVFERFRQYNIKVNPKKCKWFQKSIKILGHIVSENGIQMDPEKIKVIVERKSPTNLKQLQQFLGLCGYYRKFINNFAKIASPLYNLLKKNKVWDWNVECHQAFEFLKQELVSFPILRQPNLIRPFIVYTDASGVAIGAILAQKDACEKEYVCNYASRMIKESEKHYGISEKECLAVVWAIKYFIRNIFIRK